MHLPGLLVTLYIWLAGEGMQSWEGRDREDKAPGLSHFLLCVPWLACSFYIALSLNNRRPSYVPGPSMNYMKGTCPALN